LIEQRPDQTDDEFWAENDPYGDRFSKAIPWWGCLLLVAAVVGLLALIFKLGFVMHGV
jgi:hypothetical protein